MLFRDQLLARTKVVLLKLGVHGHWGERCGGSLGKRVNNYAPLVIISFVLTVAPLMVRLCCSHSSVQSTALGLNIKGSTCQTAGEGSTMKP